MEDLAVAAGHQYEFVGALAWLFAHNNVVQMLAGFAGGVCAAFVQPGRWTQNIGRVIIGGACGYFLHTLAFPILKFLNVVIQNDALQNADNGMAGFLVGSVGLVFFEGMLVTARTYISKISGDPKP